MLRIIILSLFVSIVLAGCATYGRVEDNGGSVGRDTISIGEFQARVREYEESVERFRVCLDALRVRATIPGISIDGVIELFGEYDQAVRVLIQDYYSLRASIGTEGDGTS